MKPDLKRSKNVGLGALIYMYFVLSSHSILLLVPNEAIQIVISFVSKYKMSLRLGRHRLWTSTNYSVDKD